MLKLTTTIRDLHGITYIKPVIIINSCNYRATTSKDSNLPHDNLLSGQRTERSSSDISLNFNALLYINEAAAGQGYKPVTVKSLQGVEWFNVPLSKLPNDTSMDNLVAIAEQWLMTNVLTPMEVAE